MKTAECINLTDMAMMPPLVMKPPCLFPSSQTSLPLAGEGRVAAKLLVKQSGSTLIMSMIIMIILMLLGVTSMVVSDTQFKLASNLQFEDSAMNNAETAINVAETCLSIVVPPPCAIFGYTDGGFTTYNTAKPYLYPANLSPVPLTMTWDDTNSFQVSGNQRYLIERLSNDNGLLVGGHGGNHYTINTYQITARGTSARGAVKFVQSFYRVKFLNN